MLQMPFDGGYVIRIEEDEEVIGALTAFCEDEGIEAGAFTGIGAVEGARLGFYNHKSGKYVVRTFKQGAEVVSFSGNISRKADGSLFPHAHILVTGRYMKAYGGHCFEAWAKPTLEIVLWTIEGALKRIEVPGKAAQLLDL